MGKRKLFTIKDLEILIKKHLMTKTSWALKALDRIYALQETVEKESKQSIFDNSVGFTRFDAPILTKLAHRHRYGRVLSDNEIRFIQNVIPKYWKQILGITGREKMELYFKEKGILHEMQSTPRETGLL